MKRYWILFVGALFALTGCGSSSEPSSGELEKKLALEIKPYVEIASLEKLISENTGTKVEPVVTTRFKAKLRLREDTYESAGYVGGAAVLKVLYKKGAEFEFYGIARSTRKGENWQTSFRTETAMPNVGQPQGSFAERGKVVIKGSPGEASLLEDVKKQQELEDAVRQKKIAEEQKGAAEERVKNAAYEKTLKSVVTAKKTYQGVLKRGEFITPILISFSGFTERSGTFSGKLYMERIPHMEKLARASNRFQGEGFRTFEIIGNISDGRLRFTMEHDINHEMWDGLDAIVVSKFVLRPQDEKKISGTLSKGGEIVISF